VVTRKSGAVETATVVWACAEREPLTPEKVIVPEPVADDDVIKVSCVRSPGFPYRGGVGLTVTPLGRPETLIVTSFVKPLRPVTESEMVWLVPGIRVTLDGAVMVKPVGLSTLTLKFALLESEPLEPAKPMAALLTLGAAAAAVNVTTWVAAPCRENDEGLAVTPAGSPLSETATLLSKPFVGWMYTLNVCVPPAFTLTLAEETASENPGVTGAVLPPPDDPEEPHPTAAIKSRTPTTVSGERNLHLSDATQNTDNIPGLEFFASAWRTTQTSVGAD